MLNDIKTTDLELGATVIVGGATGRVVGRTEMDETQYLVQFQRGGGRHWFDAGMVALAEFCGIQTFSPAAMAA